MKDAVVTALASAVATGGTAGVAWWARGGRRRTKIDNAQALTVAADAVVKLVTAEMARLEVRIGAAEVRAAEAEQLSRLLVQIAQKQQTAGRDQASWIAEATPLLRQAGIAIRDAPPWEETAIPTSVTVATTTTTITTREG